MAQIIHSFQFFNYILPTFSEKLPIFCQTFFSHPFFFPFQLTPDFFAEISASFAFFFVGSKEHFGAHRVCFYIFIFYIFYFGLKGGAKKEKKKEEEEEEEEEESGIHSACDGIRQCMWDPILPGIVHIEKILFKFGQVSNIGTG